MLMQIVEWLIVLGFAAVIVAVVGAVVALIRRGRA